MAAGANSIHGTSNNVAEETQPVITPEGGPAPTQTQDILNRLVQQVGAVTELLMRLTTRVDSVEGGISDVAARVLNITGTMDAEKA